MLFRSGARARARGTGRAAGRAHLLGLEPQRTHRDLQLLRVNVAYATNTGVSNVICHARCRPRTLARTHAEHTDTTLQCATPGGNRNSEEDPPAAHARTHTQAHAVAGTQKGKSNDKMNPRHIHGASMRAPRQRRPR